MKMDIPTEILEVKRQMAAVADKIADIEVKLGGGPTSSTETPEVLEGKLARLQIEKNELQGQLKAWVEMLSKQTSAGVDVNAENAKAEQEKAKAEQEKEKTQQEKEKTQQEKEKVRLGLATLKATMKENMKKRHPGAVSGDTSTAPTGGPSRGEEVSSSMQVNVGGFVVAQREDDAKRYFERFQATAKATDKCSLMYHPGPPPVCKLLIRGEAVTVCEYNVRDLKNAFCALRLECGDNPEDFCKKLKEKKLLNHYYDQRQKTPDDTGNV